MTGIFRPHDLSARPLGESGAFRSGVLGDAAPGLDMSVFSTVPWMTYNAATVTLQNALNPLLTVAGYCALKADGILGPATCGACQVLGLPAPASCQSKTTPARCGPAAASPGTAVVPVPAGAGLTCGAASPQKLVAGGNAATLAFQQLANQQLAATGYTTLVADSKLGPATCGAMKLLDQIAGTSYVCQYGGACVSFTMPVKQAGGGGATTSPSAIGPAVVAPAQASASSSKLVIGAAVLVGVGVLYYVAKKKGMV